MSANDYEVIRDTENDVLYVIHREVERGKTRNLSATSEILVRLHPGTEKIVGFTIEEFSRICPELADMEDYHLMEFFDNTINLMNRGHLLSAVPN